jgi:hypothetical protein
MLKLGPGPTLVNMLLLLLAPKDVGFGVFTVVEPGAADETSQAKAWPILMVSS